MFRTALSRRRTAVIHRCAAAVAGFVIAGAYASGQTNLLLDPGFEAGVAGAPNASSGDVPMSTAGPWIGWNNWVSPYSGYYTTSITAHSGTQVGKTFSGPYAGIYQYASVTGGDAYTASAWFVNSSTDALTPDETDDVRITFFAGPNGTGNNVGVVVSPVTVSNANPYDTWTQLTVQAAAPATAQSVQWMAFFIDPLYTGGSLFVDDASLLDTSWNGGGADNNWSTNNNWGGVAPGQYAPLVFAGTNRLNNNNDFAAGTPFYGIAFQPSAGSFTLNGNQVNLASDVVNNSANTQTIALGLGLQQDTNFNTTAGNVTVTGVISGTFAVTKLGAKTLTLSGANAYSGGTNVNAGTLVINPTSTPATTSALPTGGSVSITGGLLQLAPGVTGGTGPAVSSSVSITSLSITGSSQFDLNNNHIIITYGASDPITTIASYIASGYNGGHWNGPGIISSVALTNASGLLYGVGYADGADGVVAGLAPGQIEVAYTLLGDANLDGLVNSADFNILAANFNQSITGWDQGDFNYDGLVNSADFNALAANFNQGVSGAATAGDVAALDAFAAANGLSLPTSIVPEPASAALLLVGAASLLSRRSRGRVGSA
jgi:autotransporter-associated beta strand protein